MTAEMDVQSEVSKGGEDLNVNVNVIGNGISKDDGDGSYVFVTGSDAGPSEESDLTNGHCSVNGGGDVPLELEGEAEESVVVVDDAQSQLRSLTEESTQSSDPEIAVEKSNVGNDEEPQLAEEVAVQDASRDLVQDSEHELLTTQADSKSETEIVSDLELKDNGDGVPACDAHDNASASTAEQNGSSESDRALAADPVGVELELDTQVVNGSESHENGDGLPTHDVEERFLEPLVTKHLVDTAGSCEQNGQNLADNVDVQRSISDPIAEKINGSCDKNSQVSAAKFDIQESTVDHVAEDLNGSCGQISTVNGDVQENAVERVAEDINNSCEENDQILTASGDVQESDVVHVGEDTDGSIEKNGQISTANGDVQESTVQHIAEDINGSCEENGQISNAIGDVQESLLEPIAGMINATREENILAANLDVEESALETIAEKLNGPCEDMAADDAQEMSDPITERINDSCEENGQIDIVEVQKQVNESLTDHAHAHAESISEPIIINHLADTPEVNGSCEKMEVLAASVEVREQLEPQDVSGPEIMDELPIVHAHQENTSEPIATDDLVITPQEGGSSEKASVCKTVSVENIENIATVSDGDRTVCVENGDLSPKEEDSACTIDDATPENDEKNNENLISCPVEHSTSEVEAERAPIEAETFSSFAANDVISEPDSKSEIEAQIIPVMDGALLGGHANDAVSKPSPKSETEAETAPMIEHVLTGCPANDAMLEPNVKSEIESGNVPIVDDTQSSCLANAISEPISGLKCESEISPVVDDTLSSVPADGSIHEPKTILDSTDCQKTVDIVDASLSNLEAECAIADDSGKPMLQENGSVEDAATLPATLPDSSGTGVLSTITEDRPGSEDQSISAESSRGASADDASESTLVNGTDGINRSEASTSWQEVPTIVSFEEQDKVVEVEKRPFYFLIRNPRNDDENLKEQIKLAQLHVEEKTEARDAIRFKMQMQRATCKEYKLKFEAAISEERAAQDLFKFKRQEMDSVQFKINKVKDALSVEEMANTIRHMEHTMAHETLPLKEEKQYIRDIKQLKQRRDQLSFSLGKQDEVQQALDQKVHIEERIKDLRSEMDQLKSNVRKAQEVTQAAKKIYNAENDLLYELQKQFEAADATRQEAYVHLQSLKKQNYEKTKHFWRYKKDAKAANDLAVSGDKEQLQHLCITQVETFMELWNTDAEFRKEYIKCNTRSTLRRLRTLDGRSLGPDEEPPVIPDIVRVTRHNMAAAAVASAPEPIKRVTIVESEQPNDKSVALKIVKQNHEIAKTEKPVKVASSGIGKAATTTVSGRKEIEEERVEEPKPTKKDIELAKKEEELRKEEAAAKLREQRRLEEKAKAKEAMERKKRIAEKAQARAAIKAQKEAEEKEKERERRVRKKERKKASATKATNGIIEGEPASEIISETKDETPAESEATEKPVTITKRSQKVPQFTKQTKVKSIPLPLRNRSKRRMQPWMWVLITIVAVLGMLLLGNGGSFSFKSVLNKFH